MGNDLTNKTVKYLYDLANHFEYRDWNYTRQHGIKDIIYVDDKPNELGDRISKAFMWLFSPPEFMSMLHPAFWDRFSQRFRMFLFALKRSPNVPDGVLDGGKTIVYWEEDGEYLNLVQPTVGSLVAEFLMAEPDHPHAKLITKELERLHRKYAKRIKNGEVK